MGLEHIVGETQVSRRNLFRLGALGLGTYLVSQVPAFGQDAQVARNKILLQPMEPNQQSPLRT